MDTELPARHGGNMIEPPWYKSWSNWALILTYLALIVLASWFLLTIDIHSDLRGDLLDPPFPGEK